MHGKVQMDPSYFWFEGEINLKWIDGKKEERKDGFVGERKGNNQIVMSEKRGGRKEDGVKEGRREGKERS